MKETRLPEDTIAEIKPERRQKSKLLPWLLICLLVLALAVSTGFFWLGGGLPFSREANKQRSEEPRYVLPMKEFQLTWPTPGEALPAHAYLPGL